MVRFMTSGATDWLRAGACLTGITPAARWRIWSNAPARQAVGRRPSRREAVDVMGVSLATNVVTFNGQGVYRKGEYFRKELSVNNASAPVWTNITVNAAGQASVSGHALLPKAQEQFWHDADGNLTSDSLWTTSGMKRTGWC